MPVCCRASFMQAVTVLLQHLRAGALQGQSALAVLGCSSVDRMVQEAVCVVKRCTGLKISRCRMQIPRCAEPRRPKSIWWNPRREIIHRHVFP